MKVCKVEGGIYAEKLLDVSIVIGANEQLILLCLNSLLRNKPTLFSMNIYVICNNCSNNIIKVIKEQYPSVYLLINDERIGFAANHNRILRQSRARYVLILNDDTIIFPGALDAMINYMEEHPNIGLLGPKLLNPDGSLQRSIYGYPTLWKMFLLYSGIGSLIPYNSFTRFLTYTILKKWLSSSRFSTHEIARAVDALKGACMLVRRRAIENVGYIDEVTYVYEEIEWHYRFKKAGWGIFFLPSSEIIHYGRQTINRTPRTLKERVKATLNFFDKHSPKISYMFLRILLIIIFSLRALKFFSFKERMEFKESKEILIIIFEPAKIFEKAKRYYV